LRSSRFSQRPSAASPQRRFPLSGRSAASPRAGLDYHLVHTAIPETLPRGNSLGVFLGSPPRSLASFAGRVSSGTAIAAVAFGCDAEPALPPGPLKAGYAAPNTVRPPGRPHRYAGSSQAVERCRSVKLGRSRFSPRTWVSAGAGSTPACRCRSPRTLNPQQQPPTGRRQPPPGTSSMCPHRIFRPGFRNAGAD